MRIAPLVAALVVLIAPIGAEAAALSLVSRTIYQGSRLRLVPDRDSEAFRDLNRFAEWLEVGGFAFGPGDDVDAMLSVRYLTDFGTGFHRETPLGLGIPAVDGRDEVQLLYAFVDWRDVIEGRLDLRLGRQLLLDDLDWYSLDGLKATAYPFEGARIELYVGRPVPYETFLSSESAFLYDGTELDDGLSLTFGGAAFFNFGDLSASAAYRHGFVFRSEQLTLAARPGFDEDALNESLSGGTRGVTEVLIGGSLGYTIRPIAVDLALHGVWNLFFGDFDQARGSIGYTPLPSVHAELEFLRVHPRFLADSIFNYFNIHPYDRGRAEVGLEIVSGLWVDVGYFVQHFNGSEKGPRVPGDDLPLCRGVPCEYQGSSALHGPRAGVSYRRQNWGVGASAEASTNLGGRYAYGGNYRQLELFGDVSVLEERLILLVRLNYTGAQTDWFSDIDSGAVAPEIVSYGAHLGANVKITEALSARLDFIKNFESLIEGSYRLQSMVEVRYP
jgi:hypothetical protein